NVVRNAVSYSPEGQTVEIALVHESQARCVVRVRDFGPGVTEDELPRLFRPFHRVGDARDRQSGGAGLGLGIAERAVRLPGGGVAALNAQGGGLIVELSLPLAASEPDTGESATRASAG